MSMLCALVVAATVTVAPSWQDKPDVVKVADAGFEGQWRPVMLLARGKVVTEEQLVAEDHPHYSIKQNKLMTLGVGQAKFTREQALTISKHPTKEGVYKFEIVFLDEEDIVRAIAKFEGERLVICFALNGEPYPEDFKSSKEIKTQLLTLERVK